MLDFSEEERVERLDACAEDEPVTIRKLETVKWQTASEIYCNTCEPGGKAAKSLGSSDQDIKGIYVNVASDLFNLKAVSSIQIKETTKR